MLLRVPAFLALVLLPVACGNLTERSLRTEPAVAVTEMPDEGVIRPRARTAATETAPTPPSPAPDGLLGEALAGLGAPGEAGLWLRTGLVREPRRGRVVTETGAALELDLRPTGADPGAGSHLSLTAMRTLGLPLTQLATLRVYLID